MRACWFCATLMVLALARPHGWAAGDRPASLTYPGWQIPAEQIGERSRFSIVEDAEAESWREVAGKDGQKLRKKVALMARVSRRAMAKGALTIARSPLVEWGELAGGVYRVSARVSFDGDVGLIGTPIQLTINNARRDPRSKSVSVCKGNEAANALCGLDVDDPGQYYVLSFLYEMTPAGKGKNKRLKRRGSRSAYRWSWWPYQDAYPEYEPPEPKRKKTPAPPDGVVVSLRLPQTKYSVTTGKPPNSLRSVKLDWIKLERIAPSPSITIRYVKPKKVRIRPGEANEIEVSLENFTGQVWERELVVSSARGLDGRTVIHSAPVALAAGTTKNLTITWQTDEDTARWGYEVRAEIRAGRKVESSARDFFSVHPRAYPVLVKGGKCRKVDPFRENEGYANLREDFGILPGEMAQAGPPNGEQQWTLHMGGSAIAQSYQLCRTAIAHNRVNGIASTLYLWSGGTGVPVMDLYVKKPEWLSGRVAATDQVYFQLQRRAEQIRNHDFAEGPPPYAANVAHVQQPLNHWSPELQEQIERDVLAFLKNTGYDGIRFDEGLFPPRSPRSPFGEPLPLDFDWRKARQIAADQFESFKRKLRAVYPNFEFGGNRESYEYISTVGNRDRESPPPEEYPEFIAFMKAGGMIMDEPTMEIPSFGHAMNRFEDALYGMCQKRAMTRRFGGLYQLFSPGRDGTGHFAHDDIYFSTMIAVSGCLYVGGFSAPPYGEGSIAAFITRFSEFFRGPGLKPLPEAEDKIALDVDEELWFADTAVWEDVGDRRRYVVPLINPPVVDRFRENKVNEFPPPFDEPFGVEIAIPKGYQGGEAWMLTWEPDVMAKRLPAGADGATLRVEFPGLQLCRTLVVEFTK